MDQNVTCVPPTTLSSLPRILVVVPGHGEPTRTHVVQSNLRRIAAMRVITSCLMFVYGSKITDADLMARYQSCRFVRQSGFWMHHLNAVPAADVKDHDYTLLMIDGVEMNPDVDLLMLARIMEANCLSLAGPSCPSCKSKLLIRPVRDKAAFVVGRRVQYLDPQIQLYTASAFLCLQRLIKHVGLEADPTGWSIGTLSTSFCSNRVGVVDSMGVEKIYSKSTYNWTAAETTAQAAGESAMQRSPGLARSDPTRVFAPLEPPTSFAPADASTHTHGIVSQAHGQSRHESRHPAAASAPTPPPILDVITIDPGELVAPTEEEVAAIMSALRYRLRLHAAFASASIIVESNTTTGGAPRPLIAKPGSGTPSLTAAEVAQYKVVAHLVLPCASWHTRLSSYAMSSATRLRHEFHSREELLVWLETRYPDHAVYLADTTELIDPASMGGAPRKWVAAHLGACATPRLRGFRYGDPRCALRASIGRTIGNHGGSSRGGSSEEGGGHGGGGGRDGGDGGWASSAVFFRTDASWQSWRARRMLMHQSTNSPLGQRTPAHTSQPVKHAAEAGLVCPVLSGRASAYMGWNLIHALRPLRSMTAILNLTMHRPAPKHGGKPAVAAFEKYKATVRAILARGRDGLTERVQSCAEYLPARFPQYEGRATLASKTKGQPHPTHPAGEIDDTAVEPPMPGWPTTSFT